MDPGRRYPALAFSAGLICVWTFAVAARGGAHEKHRTPAPVHAGHAGADSDTVRAGEAVRVTGGAADTVSGPRFEMPPILEALGHHLHNKLIHFPIVLAPMTFLALVLQRRRSELGGLARILAWLAAVSAAGALWAGLVQASDFEGEPKEWLVLVHRNWGIATTAMLALTALAAQWMRTRRYAWVIAFLAMVSISIGAYLGGLASHG